MSVYSQEFLQKTIDHWQPRSKKKLTLEDAREIADNMAEFFLVLAELDAQYPKERK